MNELSFNIKYSVSAGQSHCEKQAAYYLQHFMSDFMQSKKTKDVIWKEEKTNIQKLFETYLISRKIIIIDYARTINDPKYFYTLATYIKSSNKKTILYSSKERSYKSDNYNFFSYNIPKKATEKNFENIYNYLLNDGDNRYCHTCDMKHIFYYCIHCGIYTCKECIYSSLKAYLWKDEDVYYIICKNCSRYQILYRLPAYYTL